MKLRRCAVLWLEPRELASFDLDDLLAGRTGVITRRACLAHAPHLPSPLEIDIDDAALLFALAPSEWVDAADVCRQYGRERVERMLELGLVVADAPAWAETRMQDESFREVRWDGLAAVWHAYSRWTGVDASRAVAEAGVDTSVGLRREHGPPPPTFALARPTPEGDIELPRIPHDGFDDLLDARSSCRNFDPGEPLEFERLAQLLDRVFGARGQVDAADDFSVMKRTSPSGGALHPTECFLVLQRVRGIAPGLYHYQPGSHRLRRLRPSCAPPGGDDMRLQCVADAAAEWRAEHWRNLARIAVAGQDYFADAAVLCVLAPRFARSFWKYRDHPKAYRVAILDAGHLSQTLQLCATQANLGAFVTAAINEGDLELALGLDAHVDGPLLVCGFGPRADVMRTSELDPGGTVWRPDGTRRRD